MEIAAETSPAKARTALLFTGAYDPSAINYSFHIYRTRYLQGWTTGHALWHAFGRVAVFKHPYAIYIGIAEYVLAFCNASEQNLTEGLQLWWQSHLLGQVKSAEHLQCLGSLPGCARSAEIGALQALTWWPSHSPGWTSHHTAMQAFRAPHGQLGKVTLLQSCAVII